VLQAVAEIMNDETRDGDVAARVGGDEFVLLIKGTEDHVLVDRIAQRIIKRLGEPIDFAGDLCRISCSIGTVLSGAYAQPTADQLLGDADAALYAAKKAGRCMHLFFAADMRDASKIA
jgi:diguanylate cyclase (GGDEF)-like protein